MKRLKLARHVLALLLAAGVAGALSPATEATTVSGSGSVEVFTGIVIVVDADLDFGFIQAPTDADAIWYLMEEEEDLLLMGKGSNSEDTVEGDHHRGRFTIHGQDGAEVNFSVDVVEDFSAEGYSLLNLKTYPSSPATLAGGSLVVYVGGRLHIDHGVPSGRDGGGLQARYQLVVNY